MLKLVSTGGCLASMHREPCWMPNCERNPVKLVRLGPAGRERPYVLLEGSTVVDVSAAVPDFGGECLGPERLDSVRAEVDRQLSAARAEQVGHRRLGSPVARPHQIVCIGLNYADHAAETGQAVPNEPIIFTKSPNTMVGPYDDVHIPRGWVCPEFG